MCRERGRERGRIGSQAATGSVAGSGSCSLSGLGSVAVKR